MLTGSPSGRSPDPDLNSDRAPAPATSPAWSAEGRSAVRWTRSPGGVGSDSVGGQAAHDRVRSLERPTARRGHEPNRVDDTALRLQPPRPRSKIQDPGETLAHAVGPPAAGNSIGGSRLSGGNAQLRRCLQMPMGDERHGCTQGDRNPEVSVVVAWSRERENPSAGDGAECEWG